MKFIFKIILYIVIFFTAVLIFLPKEGFYNLLEKELAKQNIIISNEIRDEKLFSLEIKNMNIFYDGINGATVKSIKIKTFLLSSKIDIKDLKISDSFKNILPTKINNIKISHSVLSFDKVDIVSSGDFGEFIGKYLIFENKIIGELIPSNIMKSRYKSILRELKIKDGKYTYEFTF